MVACVTQDVELVEAYREAAAEFASVSNLIAARILHAEPVSKDELTQEREARARLLEARKAAFERFLR